MAYNLTDILWIGRLGSRAVTAVGLAGMFLWLSDGISTIPKMGGQVKLGYFIGAGDEKRATDFATCALQTVMILGVLFGIICLAFSNSMVRFFRLEDPTLISEATLYLRITGACTIFPYVSKVLSGLLTATGNGTAVLIANTIGVALNLLLDPFLIFGIGPFPAMGVLGTALGTVIAQAVVTLILVRQAAMDKKIFANISLRQKISLQDQQEIVAIGLPAAVHGMSFTVISMCLTRIIGSFGAAAVAVQRVGSQLESLSWLTTEGFASAVNAFMAQNHGQGSNDRIKKGYQTAISIALCWGLFCNLFLFFGARPLFSFFLPEADILPMGMNYLRIISVSQLFMCLEITTAGAFSGLGKTLPPAVLGITFTALRIPAALVLMATPLGLNGIWWSIAGSSILKGTLQIILFLHCEKSIFRNSSLPMRNTP